jgi:hypothetical protein
MLRIAISYDWKRIPTLLHSVSASLPSEADDSSFGPAPNFTVEFSGRNQIETDDGFPSEAPANRYPWSPGFREVLALIRINVIWQFLVVGRHAGWFHDVMVLCNYL